MPSKKNLPTLVTSSHTSRNTNDWSYEVDDDGRHVFRANRKGVRTRMGIIVTLLNRGATHRRMILAYVRRQTKNSTYTDADLSQPFKQLAKHGIAVSSGRGSEATWSLTKNGKKVWAKLPKAWR